MTLSVGIPAAGRVIRIETEARKNDTKIGSYPALVLTTDEHGNFKYILPGTFTSQDLNSIHLLVCSASLLFFIKVIAG